MRVQEQRAPAARPAHAADHVRAARPDLLVLRLDPVRLEPARDEAADFGLARAALDERRVHGLDGDELRDELRASVVPLTARAYRGFVFTLPRFGRLAQLVERLLYTQVVAGSSPAPPIPEAAC